MNKYFVLILSLMFTFACSEAADIVKTAPKTVVPKAKQVVSKPVETPISRAVVLGFLNGANKTFLDGLKTDKPSPSIKYFSAAGMVKNWLNFRFLEVDTEIDRSWYEKTYKILDYLAKTKDYIELAKMNGRATTDEYKKSLSYFSEASKRLSDLLENPTPVDKKKLDKLHEEKKKWESEKRRAEAKKKGVNLDE